MPEPTDLTSRTIARNGRLFTEWSDGTILPVIRGGDGPEPESALPAELQARLDVLADATDDEVDALLTDLRAHYASVREGDDARSRIPELEQVRDAVLTVRTAQAERAEATAQADAALAALDAELSTPEEEDEQADDEADAPDPAPEPEEATTPEPEVEPEPQPVAAAARPAPIAAAARHVPASHAARPAPARPARNPVIASIGSRAGQEVDGIAGLAPQMLEAVRAVRPRTDGLFLAAGAVKADFASDRILGATAEENMRLIHAAGAGSLEALTAAGGICVPAEPYYGQEQIATAARPVRAALTNFGMPRGSVTYIPPRDISDYTGGVDEWTVADDEAVTSSSNTWKTVLDLTCEDPVTVQLRAVTAIATHGVWYERTSPEQVAADTLNLAAAHSRKAESLLLDDILAGSQLVNVPNIVGVARDVLVRVAEMAANVRNVLRMDPLARLTFLAPAWLRDAMVGDITLQAPGDDVLGRGLAEVTGYLTSRGIDANWYFDSPSGSNSQYFTAHTSTTFRGYPSYVQFGLFPDGTWLFGDGGELDLGAMRDFDLARQNKVATFMESFEKAVKVGTTSLWGKMVVDVSGGYSGSEDIGS